MKIKEDFGGFISLCLESTPPFDDPGIRNLDIANDHVQICYLGYR